ncbi:hypothetical protein NDU88_001046 [Pleurodeles waltl]|uniref:Uncharacterized protein n=1 Tax=Pleurodeles waltl TaxID=8319 RepID=A0AAV7VAS3_PLEWA|nr:hypothetical protein NDU88_001046 [Pleurodeles waltl]
MAERGPACRSRVEGCSLLQRRGSHKRMGGWGVAAGKREGLTNERVGGVGPKGAQRRGKPGKQDSEEEGEGGRGRRGRSGGENEEKDTEWRWRGAETDLPAEAGSKDAPCYRATAAIRVGEGGSGSWEEGGLDE